MHSVPEASFKPVPVEEGQKKLKIRLLSVVGRGGHEEEVTGQAGEKLSEAVALRVFDLPAEEGGGKLMGFVADYEVYLQSDALTFA